MKGLELPINMIVVVAIAVLVLVVVAAFFAGRLGEGTGSINLEAAFSDGCNRLRATYNCANLEFPINYQESGNPNPTTLFSRVCVLKGYSPVISNEPNACTRACGCVISTP